MKKTYILSLCLVFLLSGCSQWNAIMDKMPWQKDEENQSSSDENAVPHDTDDRSNPSSNDKDDGQAGQENEESDSSQGMEEDKLTLESAFFNEIKMVDGKKVIQNPSNIVALVNKQYALPSSYIPADLMRPNVPFPFGDQKIEKSYLRKEAARALEKMFAQAKRENIELFGVSGYRSYKRQQEVFSAEVNRVGEKKAVLAVAIPGFSEHQSGLAMDISSPSVNYDLTESYGNTKEGKWLVANAHRFGFILRYPKGKEQVTGYQYEPWHFRYVGIQAATDIFERNLTLEEYFNVVEKI